MLAMAKLAFPELVRVTDCAALVLSRFWFPKAMLAAERLADGPLPVPVRATVCGLPVRLSAMLTEAVRVPATVGTKATEIVQLAATAREAPQVLVWIKSPAFVPVMVMPVMLKL